MGCCRASPSTSSSTSFGRSLHPVATVAVGPEGPLTDAQRATADRVVRAFLAAGFPLELAVAAVVNAWAEGRLYTDRWGDPRRDPEGIGCSGGVFQLNRCGGAGMGMSRSAVLDPDRNISRIIEEVNGHFGRTIRASIAAGERDIPKLTALFTTGILRPGEAETVAAYRAKLARKMFPPDALRVVATW